MIADSGKSGEKNACIDHLQIIYRPHESLKASPFFALSQVSSNLLRWLNSDFFQIGWWGVDKNKLYCITGLAQGLNTELEEQNDLLDNIDDQAAKAGLKINQQNKDMNKILGKK